MEDLLYKYSTRKTVLVLILITNIVYVIMMAFTIPRVAGFAVGMKLLDLMPAGYDFEYVQRLFTALGEEGRSAYLRLQLPIDMIYPLLFAVCYCLLLVWLLKIINKQHTRLFYASYLPLFAGSADYLENIGIITLLRQYPQFTSESVQITSRFSVVKSSITTVYFIVVLMVLLAMVWYWFRKGK